MLMMIEVVLIVSFPFLHGMHLLYRFIGVMLSSHKYFKLIHQFCVKQSHQHNSQYFQCIMKHELLSWSHYINLKRGL